MSKNNNLVRDQFNNLDNFLIELANLMEKHEIQFELEIDRAYEPCDDEPFISFHLPYDEKIHGDFINDHFYKEIPTEKEREIQHILIRSWDHKRLREHLTNKNFRQYINNYRN